MLLSDTNSSCLSAPRCGCAGAAHYLDLRYSFFRLLVEACSSTATVRETHTMPPLHCTATAPSLRAMHLSPGLATHHDIVRGSTTHHRFPFGLLSCFSHRPWLSGGVTHTGRAHEVGTDQEGSSLHGRWWCPQVAARVGLCVEGLSMIMTRPGPLASSPVRCLNHSPTPGARKRICDAVWLCGLVFFAVWVFGAMI